VVTFENVAFSTDARLKMRPLSAKTRRAGVGKLNLFC